jgi:hypothetical protein
LLGEKQMKEILAAAVAGALSYFVAVFSESHLFQPGLGQRFAAWKVLFFFLAAGSVFISASRKGLACVFAIAVIAAIVLGVNYGSNQAYPPVMSATDLSWFAFQLCLAGFVGIAVRLAAELMKILPKDSADKGHDGG